MLVDSFVKWRITDVQQLLHPCRRRAAARRAASAQTVPTALRAEFGKRTVHDVVSGERDKIMSEVREKADQDLRRRSASRSSTCA